MDSQTCDIPACFNYIMTFAEFQSHIALFTGRKLQHFVTCGSSLRPKSFNTVILYNIVQDILKIGALTRHLYLSVLSSM